jgi:alkanesulfonate monooxygenase SsuD/methylene tetrahydromethanopterin reductase-like flavin-dependent oxidoreductase (luciferase family)
MAATLDEVSDGRLMLGIGAGWHDPEYEAFGYPTDRRGSDGPRVLRMTGRYGDAWNDNGFGFPDDRLRTVLQRLDEALEAEGRDPTTVERTIGVTGRHPDVAIDPDDEPAFQGTTGEMAAMFDAYAELGVDHLILEVGPKTVASIGWVADAIQLFRR